MRTTNQPIMAIVAILLLFSTTFTFAQTNPDRPQYLTATTMHWNMDKEDFDMNAWKAIEKEYLEKVTMKNEYITSSSYYLHLFTPDNSEVLFVRTYPSWEAIDKAAARNAELEKLAWPDEKTREAFFKKLGDYFSVMHSDEIYAPMDGAKVVPKDNTKDLVLYVRKTHFTYPEDGSFKEFDEMRAESFAKVLSKNEYIRGYYPNVHAWGNDKTEFVEAFFVDSMCDMEKMFDKNSELISQAWPGDSGKKRGKKWGKYFTGVHGDAAYTLVAELSK